MNLLLDNNHIYHRKGSDLYRFVGNFYTEQDVKNAFDKSNWVLIKTENRTKLYYVMPSFNHHFVWNEGLSPIKITTQSLTFNLHELYDLYDNLAKQYPEYIPFGDNNHMFIGKEDLLKVIDEKEAPTNRFCIKTLPFFTEFNITLHYIPNLNESFLVPNDELR